MTKLIREHNRSARLGHADPAVTLRVYSHVLREHAVSVGDVFAQAIKAGVSKPVSKLGNNKRPLPAFPLVRKGEAFTFGLDLRGCAFLTAASTG